MQTGAARPGFQSNAFSVTQTFSNEISCLAEQSFVFEALKFTFVDAVLICIKLNSNSKYINENHNLENDTYHRGSDTNQQNIQRGPPSVTNFNSFLVTDGRL